LVEPLEPVVPAPLDVPMLDPLVVFDDPEPLVSELADPVLDDGVEDDVDGEELEDELGDVVLDDDGEDDEVLEDGEDGVVVVVEDDGVVVVVVVDVDERPETPPRSSWRLHAVVSTREPSSADRMIGIWRFLICAPPAVKRR
jgi:hypothetical protein